MSSAVFLPLDVPLSAEQSMINATDGDMQQRWAERHEAAAQFTSDLEYKAKEFMRPCGGGEDPPAYIFPLDDEVISQIFAGSAMLAKEIFEKAGAVHYATVPGTETIVLEAMERRKAEARARIAMNAGAQGPSDSAGAQGPSDSAGASQMGASSSTVDDGSVDDDLWFAIRRMSPVQVQKIVNVLRQLITAYLRDSEASQREEAGM
jgi:hypothetical protein